MRTRIHKIIVLIAFGLVSYQLFGQNNPAGLTVIAAGNLFSDKVTKLSLTVHLINSTNHDITVLTNQNRTRPATIWIPINETPEPKKLLCQIGLFENATSNGVPIVPPLSELGPVTLKPNEETTIHLSIEQNEENPRALRLMGKDTQIIVQYKILPQWGDRFACWSGEVRSEPFIARLIATSVKRL